MRFVSASESAFIEIKDRLNRGKNLRSFGVDFLDDATEGIVDDDLVLLGADSGVGKTQLCVNIALANMAEGKRVHYIPLEAGKFEIERRLKYQLIVERYYSSTTRPTLSQPLSYRRWSRGLFIEEMPEIENEVAEFFEKGYRDLFLCYKDQKFDVTDMIEQVVLNADNSDLIILDHVHMMDWEDNDNSAIKKIAITARDLALTERKPIILVAHLRKRDPRYNLELCPNKEEFHGSSDLYKVATVVITISPGGIDASGDCETFMRIPKAREEGGVTRFMGRTFFSPKKGKYVRGYKLGWATSTIKNGLIEVDRDMYPEWALRHTPKS